MDKVSIYNVIVPHGDNVLVYNSLSNSLVCLTGDEYSVVSEALKDLESFQSEYKSLYDGFKKSGFIVDGDMDEIAYVRFMNNKAVYESTRYHLTVNPTLDCNLKCWYCSTECTGTVHSGRMSDSLVNAVKAHVSYLVDKIRISSLHLDWFGGEPLMYFREVVEPISRHTNELVEESGIMFTQHATTNSVFIYEEMAKDMADLHFTSFQITLDGNQRHHDVIKRKSDKTGTFRQIVDNINLLSEVIPNVNIILRINYDKKTLYGIEEVIPLITDNAKKHINVDFQKVWQIKTNGQLSKVRASFEANGFITNYCALSPKVFRYCYADCLHHYGINYDGRVFKCTARGYGENNAIGHLKEDGHIDWNYKLLSKLFSTASFDNEKCLGCNLMPACMGKCVMKRNFNNDNGPDFECFKDRYPHYVEEYVVNEARRRGLLK